MAIKDGDKKPQATNNPIVVMAPTGPDGKVSAVSPTEKYAFHGATPCVQRSGSAQAAVSASTGPPSPIQLVRLTPLLNKQLSITW